MLCFLKVELILNNIMIKKIQSILGLKRNPNYKSLQTIVKSLKTFAVFLLVKKFDFTVKEITILFVINNIVNYFLSPLIGRSIVRFGERKVLSLEYFSLFFIFLSYAIVQTKAIITILYILDHIFFNFAIAIRTYFQKIGDPRDIAPSMAVGFTINHIAAVVFPAVGGYLWMIDYRIPFACGALLSLISLFAVQKIRIK